MTRQLTPKYKIRSSVTILSLICHVCGGMGSICEAKRFVPSRKSSTYEVGFRSQDPKTFYRSLSLILEQQPPDQVTTINAKAAMGELLFQTENYREAAQIYLQLTEAPLADNYKLSSFQYRLAECYFYMGLYGESYDQFSRVRQEGHKSLQAEATLGMAMAALAQGNRASAQKRIWTSCYWKIRTTKHIRARFIPPA